MSSKKRKEQYRASKSNARQQRRAHPRIYKAFKKADAERKRKKRAQEGQEKKHLLKEIERLKAKVQEQKKGYQLNLARKEDANAKARSEQTKHLNEKKAKTAKWEGFWKRLPLDMQDAVVARSRGAYPKNCPRRGCHKDEDYWDPRISGRL